jgi:hypothetical protein
MPREPQVRRLALPGGGQLAIPMPSDSRMFVQAPPALSLALIPPVVPIAAGAVLGGLLTWLLLRMSR